MRNTPLGEKFQNYVFVKPLYRKVVSRNLVKPKRPFVSINTDSSLKLRGDGIDVKRKITSDTYDHFNSIKLKNKRDRDYDIILPGISCKEKKDVIKILKPKHKTFHVQCKTKVIGTNTIRNDFKMLSEVGSSKEQTKINVTDDDSNKNYKIMEYVKPIVIHKVPDTWLRIYPAPKAPGETIISVILRCIFCQLGLIAVLIMWTLLWVFIIHYFEGPHETEVSLKFAKEQNQLVIDLATELRQITPLSPKWRAAIEQRLEDERELTVQAVGKGARVEPGRFWDLAGTFLFTVYVMTALGFGAPVPQTLYGRTSALLYAFLAVPTHIYIMVNASTCLVVHAEACIHHLKIHCERTCFLVEKDTTAGKLDSQNSSRNSDLKKRNQYNLRKNMCRILHVFCTGRCVPLAAMVYYGFGAIVFGVLRDNQPLEVVMFPLEFTTSGGLEIVASHVKLLYAVYVEGAMALLACAVATLRRYSSTAIGSVAKKYRLFDTEKCKDCIGEIQ